MSLPIYDRIDANLNMVYHAWLKPKGTALQPLDYVVLASWVHYFCDLVPDARHHPKMGNLASEPETRFWKRFYTNVTINQHTTHIEDIEDTSPMSPLALASDACAGGIIFWSGLSLAQVMQKCLRVSSATPIFPQVIGCISIACLSTASVWYAALPRKLLLDYNKSTSDQWKKITTLYEYMTAFYHMRMQTTSLSMHPIYCMMGFIIFRVLGGRMLAIAPSDYRFLGAFHRFESSASATQMYAGDKIRLMMQSFGRRTGCHTCGSRRHSLYHADHMPPNEWDLCIFYHHYPLTSFSDLRNGIMRVWWIDGLAEPFVSATIHNVRLVPIYRDHWLNKQG